MDLVSKHGLTIGTALWFVCVFLYILDIDFMHRAAIQTYDYLTTFYVAGTLARTGNIAGLYPEPGSTTFFGQDFYKLCHQLLPWLPERFLSSFLYMPIVAFMFAPLSTLERADSLIAWQIISLGALFASCALVSYATPEPTPGRSFRTLRLFLLACALCPVDCTLQIGHVGIVMGILPLSLGWFLMQRNLLFLSGLVFGLLMLRPQYLLPAVVLAIAFAFKKEFRPLNGMIAACAGLIAVNFAMFGPTIMSRWANGFLLGDTMYSDTTRYPHNKALIFGLPRAILYWLPQTWTQWLKVPVYALCSSFALAVMYLASKIGRANLTDSRTLAMVASLAAVAGPLFTPHFFYHDFTLLLLPYLLLSTQKFEDAAVPKLKFLAWFGWLVLFIFGMLIQFNPKLSVPLLMSVAVVYGFRQLWVLCKAEKAASIP